MHATFYLHLYGSSQNFFSRTLESALKSTVKVPTRITSHCQDHIWKEFAHQQHKWFICVKSCCERTRYDKLSFSSIGNSKIPAIDENQNKQHHIDTENESIVTDKPKGRQLHTPVFYLMCKGDEKWLTHIRKYTHRHSIVYPNFMVMKENLVFQKEQEYVRKVAEHAHEHIFQQIDCSCDAMVPFSHGNEWDFFHCHPSFHLYSYLKRSWYDWAMVKWLVNNDDDDEMEKEVLVAAHIFLFAHLSKQHRWRHMACHCCSNSLSILLWTWWWFIAFFLPKLTHCHPQDQMSLKLL